jgi:signal transduction histidine kinase
MHKSPSGPTRRLGNRLFRAFASIRAAIVLTVTIGMAIPATLMLFDEIGDLREEHDLAVHDDIGRLTALLAMSMREPMWQIAPDQALSIIDAAFIDERIVAVRVMDDEQRMLARKERPPPDDSPGLVHSRPIERNGQTIGSVVVEMSTTGYRKKLDVIVERFVRRTLLGLSGSLLLIALILHYRLARPVRQIADASARLAVGQLDEPMHIRRSDELGRVAQNLEATRLGLLGLISKLELQNNELINANDQLESRVAERTQALQEAVQTLKRAQIEMVESEKLASLGRIVAGVAHELNTPIGNALTVASTLHDQLQPLNEEYTRGAVRKSTLAVALGRSTDGFAILLRSLEKAAAMIGNFKQVAVDQTSEQRRKFDLAEVTEDVLATLLPSFKKTPIRINMDLAPRIPCDSYPGPYGQVLTNLVMNALVHAFEGRSEGNVLVRVDCPRPGMARLQVLDDGIGMDEAIRRRIFDPFFTTRLGRGGSGLGMNIALSIVVRILQGTISVDSRPGDGSRFIVEFPCAPMDFQEERPA